MDDDTERTNRILDDLAAERDPRDRGELSPEEAEQAKTAAFLKAAHPERRQPSPAFLVRLQQQLLALSAQAQTATPPSEEGQRLSRRGLLGRLAAGAAVGAIAAGSAGGVAAAAAYEQGKREGYHQQTGPYHEPLVPDDRGQWLDTGHAVSAVAPGQAVPFQAGAIAGFLVNPGAGHPIYALSASCTHMGCLISWATNTGSFLCPCHGAQYNVDGTVLSGIARRPLPRLRVRSEPDGHLYIWGVTAHPTVTALAPYSDF